MFFESTVSSDHLTVYFEINIKESKKHNIHHVFNYKKTDFSKLILDLSNANLFKHLTMMILVCVGPLG